MLDRLHALGLRLANGRAVALLAGATSVAMYLFDKRAEALGVAGSPDSRPFSGPAGIQLYLEGIGAEGRALYAVTEMTLDLAFPLVYGALLAALLAWRYDRAVGLGRQWLLLPIAAIAADLTENTLLAFLALTFVEGMGSPLGWVVAGATLAKFGLILLTLVVIVVRPGYRLSPGR